MTVKNQEQYRNQFEKQLTIVCCDAEGALIDTYMFMYPAANRQLYSSTHLYIYSLCTIRQRAILSVKKLIEPSGKDRINVHSIVEMILKPDFDLMSKIDKQTLSNLFFELFNSDAALRVKNFRDAFCHNIPNNDEAFVFCKDVMHIMNGVLFILSTLYREVLKKDVDIFVESKEIATVLSQDYWNGINSAAKTVDSRVAMRKRLDQLLNREF